MSDTIEKCMILLKSYLKTMYVNTIYCFIMAKNKKISKLCFLSIDKLYNLSI